MPASLTPAQRAALWVAMSHGEVSRISFTVMPGGETYFHRGITLASLERRGLLRAAREELPGVPRYTLTPAGRAALEAP